MRPSYFVYVSARGNVFMTEIAGLLAAALGDLGYTTVFPAPGLPERAPNRVNLVVAPHEFFPLQRGIAEGTLLKAAAAAVAVGVEQPGTAWFELGAHYASAGPAVLDISNFAVNELVRRGLDATHLQLGYHPSWDHWSGDVTRTRRTDLVFLGSVTPRRQRILSAAAPFLWDCSADIRLFEFPRPMDKPRGNFVAGSAKWELLASSRIVLNIHRDAVPYFEWVRVLEAVVNGCLVISECSTDYGPLVPGRHLVAVPEETVGAYAASLMTDEPLRAEMALSAYDFVRSELVLTTLLAPVCAKIEEVALKASPARQILPLPAPSLLPAPAGDQPIVADLIAGEFRVRARVKKLLDSELELIRRVEALQSSLEHRNADHVETAYTRAWDGSAPQISVVITSYNYRAFIVEAMESIVSSEGVCCELIVVDDHSQDDSVAVIRDFMAAHAWYPIALVARAANVGLSMARNTGIAHARSERLFILDADNTVYPNCLAKLSTALDRAPEAAMSYGMIAKSDGSGFLSFLPWYVERLCQENYIDAMAMVRLSAMQECGGYDPYFGKKGGWEDYDLWLRLAANGHRAEFVPEIVGWYRVHATSLLQTLNLDSASLMKELRARYPFLPWRDG